MRRTRALLSTAALLFVSTSAFAQAKPNFSGKWSLIPPDAPEAQQAARGASDMGGLGATATIAQDDKTLTITRSTTNIGELKSVFNLDGSETASSVTVQGNAIPLTLKGRWDGARFITSTWLNVGQQIEIILVLSLDDKGNLVTEHTFPDLGTGMGGGTITAKYKKQ